LKEGFRVAGEAIDSGRALKALEGLVRKSRGQGGNG
jgi:anthranilate phosphoribosyltransferase